MKFIHLSDLHLGKSVHEFSMIEDQEYILDKLLAVIDDQQPQCLLISGDVFDRTIASIEALRLFDDFLVGLVRRNVQVFVISGNHDSADRLAFGSRLIAGSGIHIGPAYDGNIASYTITDEYGDIDIYLLPFLKPMLVRRHFPDQEINSWTDALCTVIENLKVNPERRNILLAHQFVTGAFRSDSEEISVGGADHVDADVFDVFDYVALGHLHRAQCVRRETLRYCGTPLKYSFSEANQQKSVTVVELREKGGVIINEIALVPKRDLRQIKGKYLEVTAKQFYQSFNLEDYFHITLTDEEGQPDALGKLRIIYPHLMLLDYDNQRTRCASDFTVGVDAGQLAPMELFETLFRTQNHQDLSETQRDYLGTVMDQVWEEVR